MAVEVYLQDTRVDLLGTTTELPTMVIAALCKLPLYQQRIFTSILVSAQNMQNLNKRKISERYQLSTNITVKKLAWMNAWVPVSFC
ncbi:MAG: hypothetical protein OIF58_05355 [Cohaesibacter sp.]|nr:hypothetical protein [Cohaesibacter sp.]